MATFHKLEPLSLKDAFIQDMLSKILSGELKPGSCLPPERELAKQLGISRSSINHGIVQLEGMGFLTIVPRKGTFVNDYRKDPTPQSLSAVMSYGSIELEHTLFSDLMATRLLLECECARLACANITPELWAQLNALADTLEQEEGDPTETLYQFHYLLTQSSGNIVYSMIFRGFEPVLRTLIRQHYSVQSADRVESAALHRSLLSAISARDPDQAEHYARRIIEQGNDVLEKKYSPQ